MSAIIWALIRPVLGQVLLAIVKGFTDYLADKAAIAAAEQFGHAKAEAEAARIAAAAAERMGEVPLPSDDEVVEDLRNGNA